MEKLKCYLCNKTLKNWLCLEMENREYNYVFCDKCSNIAGKVIRDYKKSNKQ